MVSINSGLIFVRKKSIQKCFSFQLLFDLLKRLQKRSIGPFL